MRRAIDTFYWIVSLISARMMMPSIKNMLSLLERVVREDAGKLPRVGRSLRNGKMVPPPGIR